MKFEITSLGNRVCIKTIKKTYCKVTYLTVEEAKRTLKKINENGWEIKVKDNSIKTIL